MNDVASALDPRKLMKWLKGRTGEYDYISNHECLIARYLRDTGHAFVSVSGVFVRLSLDSEDTVEYKGEMIPADGVPIPTTIHRIARPEGSSCETYQRAYERAKAVCAELEPA